MNININIPTQSLDLKDDQGDLVRRYSISSARNGTGQATGSYCTPLGAHIVRAKIGGGLPENTVFVGYSGNAATLNILPGCKLAFVSGSGLVCGDFGAQSGLVIEGTPSERIELTGKVETAGSWKGIAFFSNNPINSIKYTDIRFGGASSLSGNTAQKGNILVGLVSSPGYVSIANSTLSSSAAYGMYVTAWSTGMSEPTTVTYAGNISGDYFQEP